MKARAILILSVSLFVGLAAGLVSLILPNRYTAKGLLLVTRKADSPSAQVFTYEGYYAQQNAGTYTGTFMAILQSPGNLKSSNPSYDVKTLSRLVRTKRDGSQAIVLTTKGNTQKEAGDLWTKTADGAIKTHNQLKETADPLLTVSVTPGSPVIQDTYPNKQSIFLSAFLFSVVVLSSVILIIRYIKEEHDH